MVFPQTKKKSLDFVMGQFEMIKSVDLSSFFLIVTNGSVSNDHNKLELILVARSKVLTFFPSSLAFEIGSN